MTIQIKLETLANENKFSAKEIKGSNWTDKELAFSKSALSLVAKLTLEEIEWKPVFDLGSVIVINESEYGEVTLHQIDNGKDEIRGGNLALSSVIAESILAHFKENYQKDDSEDFRENIVELAF